MSNVKIYKHFLHFLFSKVTDTQAHTHTHTLTYTHTHTETDKTIAIDEILQICLTSFIEKPFENYNCMKPI